MKICQKCRSSNLNHDATFPYHDIYECHDCGHLRYASISDCCRKPELIVANLNYDHQRIALFHQCCNCGGAVKSKLLKHKDYQGEIEAAFYEESFQAWKTARSTEGNLVFKSILEANYRNSRAYKYYQYLESAEWKKKRVKVMKRDGHLCQICKKGKARDVHHLTYDRLFDESLEDLQALCRPCHIKLHEQNRNALPSPDSIGIHFNHS